MLMIQFQSIGGLAFFFPILIDYSKIFSFHIIPIRHWPFSRRFLTKQHCMVGTAGLRWTESLYETEEEYSN